MLEGVKVALDPSPAQQRLLLSHAGAARFAFNSALAHIKAQLDDASHESADGATTKTPWNHYSLRLWWNASKEQLAPWWAENSKEAYSSGLESLSKALKAWNDGRNGTRKGTRPGFPVFKSRIRSRSSWAYTTGSFGIADPYGVRLPRIGRVHTHERIDNRIGRDRIARITISSSRGRWFAVFTVERDRPNAKSPGSAIGVDLGVKHLAVLSDGRVIANPSHLDTARRRLRKASRALDRTVKDSAGRVRATDRLAKEHARVANLRSDSLHKLTTSLARRHSVIVIEDLNVAGMLRNHSLARVISDASFGEFRRQLEYKALKFGSEVIVADRFYPSSKTCSSCGAVKAKLRLEVRTFRCEQCGHILDRDLNAAKNLLALARPIAVAGSGPETQNGGGASQKTRMRAGGSETTTMRPRLGSDMDRQLVTVASRSSGTASGAVEPLVTARLFDRRSLKRSLRPLAPLLTP